MKRPAFTTKEWILLAAALAVGLAFLPGANALGRLTSTAYSLIPLGLACMAAFCFYRWWVADEEQSGPLSRPTSCPGCGTAIADHWHVCPMCARNLEQERLYCRHCAQPMHGAWKVCPSCSHPVETHPGPVATGGLSA